MRLHFQSYGSGEPLVVLHGLFGSGDNWVPFARQLSGRFQVILLDARNHGHSPHAPEMSYATMAADVEEFMAEQGIVSAHVLGHSMGGKTAMELALASGGRIRKLIVVDMAPRAYAARHNEIIEALWALDLSQYSDRRGIEIVLEDAIPDLVVRRFLLKNLARGPAGDFRWRLGLEEIRDNYGQMNEGLARGRSWAGACLFVRGEVSDYVDERDLAVIREFFPAGQVCTIAGAGHWVHADAPEAFRGAVERFLDNVVHKT